jgi:hypothetical protein
MADDSQQLPTRSKADKDRARQQSRSVSGQGTPKSGETTGSSSKARAPRSERSRSNGQGSGPARTSPAPASKRPATKPGAKGGAAPRSAQRRPARTRRSPSFWLTAGAIAVVVAVVVVLVVVKLTGSSTSSSSGTTTFTPAPASVVHDVTNIPASVYDKVGVTSSTTQVTPPTVLTGQPALVDAATNKPLFFYEGGEFCPYCAAERWAMIAALSRFGTFTNLGEMQSSLNDVYPGTQTFTFAKSTYTSPYLAAQLVEHYSSVQGPSGNYTVRQPLTSQQKQVAAKYNTSQFVPGGASGSIPFVDIGNRALISGASYSPSILAGLSREQIASNLSNPSNPVTQAIVATANYITAGICATTGQQPTDVCTSKGVTEAAKAMGLGA